jgi:hypothetical protein
VQTPDHSADAAQVRALLSQLSRARLSVSAELSAAAGALEDDRADIAADMLAGAQREMSGLRAAARQQPPAPVPAQSIPDTDSRGGPRHRLARALAGAAALAMAIAVVPQITRSSSHPTTGAAAAGPATPAITLASNAFTALTQRLTAANASPTAILAAGRSWQAAVSHDLPTAAGSVASASSVVTMLRVERTLLQASPALRAPQNRTVAQALDSGPNSLLTQLRRLASPSVLQTLPAIIQALPLATTSTPGTTVAGAAPSTGATAPVATGPVQAAVPNAPLAGPTAAPASPAPATSASPAPTDGVPVPLPSTLGQLTGDGQGGLGQTVGNVLSGLGLGG